MKKLNGKSVSPSPPRPPSYFKKTCFCTILPPLFLIFQISPSKTYFRTMLDDREMHCQALCQCVKAPHFPHYISRNIHLPASLKKPFPLLVQLQVQNSVASNSTVLNSRCYHSFLFRMATQGVMGHLIKT